MSKHYRKKRRIAPKKRPKYFRQIKLSMFLSLLWKYILYPLIIEIALNSSPIKHFIETILGLY